jgi:hypothetical protein
MIKEGEHDPNITIQHLTEKFSPDTDDPTWITSLASEGDWIIISGDPRISRDKGPREAWHQSGLTAFFLYEKFSSKQFWKQAEFLVSWWPDIKQKAGDCRKGTGFRLNQKPAAMHVIYEP